MLSKNNAIFPLLILLASLAVYINTFGNDFTNWDDDELVLYNYRIQDLNLEKLKKIFTTPTVTDYLPIKELSYALDYYFWKLNPFGYHLSNLILYISNSLLVYLILNIIFNDKPLSLLATVIFAVHPIHVESVAWISGRKDLLSGFFFFLSFYAYLKNRNLFAFVFFIPALLSKPTVIILPLILILYEMTISKEERKWKKISLKVFPFFLVAAFSAFVTLKVGVEKGVVKEHIGDTLMVNLLLMSGVFFDYVKLLLFPVNLCIRYMIPIEVATKAIIFLLFLLSFLILSITKIKFNSRILFFLLWPVITILPTSNIIPISTLKADRYLYFPSFAFAAIIALLLNKVLNKTSKAKMLFVIIPIILSFSILTFERNKVWKDSITLMEDTVKKSPDLFVAYNNLGIAYSDAKIYDKAINSYKKALKLNTNFAKAHANIGTLYATVGDYQKALVEIKTAIREDPLLLGPQFNLGLLYYKIGLLDEAIIQYEKVLRLNPEHEEYRKALNRTIREKELILKEMENPKKAKIIKMKNSDNYNNLGIMESNGKMYKDAEIAFRKAILYNPENKMARLNLATICFLKGDFDNSLTEYENVLKSYPEFSKAYWNLGLIYEAKGDKVKALDTFKKILEVEPDNKTVLKEIENLKR